MARMKGAKDKAEDIYFSGHMFENAKKQIKLFDKANRQHVEAFVQYCLSDGLGKLRIVKLLAHLKGLIAAAMGKNLATLKEADIRAIVATIEQKPLSDWTKHDYKVCIKKFYKWLRNSKEDPVETAWIKVTMKKKQRLPEEILNEEDVLKLLNACKNSRDKALIAVLFDSGARIGELTGLKLKHVTINEKTAQILIPDGKTGARRVLLVPSVPHLAHWLNDHPFKSNPDAPLWIKIDGEWRWINEQEFKQLLKADPEKKK